MYNNKQTSESEVFFEHRHCRRTFSCDSIFILYSKAREHYRKSCSELSLTSLERASEWAIDGCIEAELRCKRAADVESLQVGGFYAPCLSVFPLALARVSKVNNSSRAAPCSYCKDETCCILLHGKRLSWRQIDACAVAR